MFKKILTSKIFKYAFSVVLIYFAFRKVDVRHLAVEIASVPPWFIVAMSGYFFVTMFVNSVRWCLLILDKPTIKDFFIFTRATYLGGFYSLFFPTMVAGDLMKWMPLLKHYPELSKTKMLGSVLLDRVVGFSAFVPMGLMALIVGRRMNYQFPDIILWLFSGLTLGIAVFYIMVYTINFDKIFGRFKFLGKILEIVDLLKNENKKRIIMCFLIAAMVEPIWILPFWFYSVMFGVGLSMLQTFIFVPIIALTLVLPISVAGFGARENLFLFFLTPLGFLDEKVLLMSTFAGIMTVITNLIGGVFMLIPDEVVKVDKINL